jgi:hypothetical protein
LRRADDAHTLPGMSKFTKAEVEAEHRRRRREVTERVIPIGQPNARCFHCGQPFDATTAVAGDYGLCDNCNLKD